MSGRHPFELYLLYLTLLVSVPIVLGAAPRPGSVADLLPDLMAWGWSLILAVGSAVALLGIFWRERVTGLIAEQVGLVLVGVATLAYTVMVFHAVGDDGLVQIAIVGGYGASCIRRYFQIQQILDVAHQIEKRGLS